LAAGAAPQADKNQNLSALVRCSECSGGAAAGTAEAATGAAITISNKTT